ncbi:cAMP phosphodiesterases class-II-domain-containing protein [Lasiosphaeris hirsuta]|uniref:cAMP phosphodiesterases class-II-domain-containing protein n=1 Tax=Lasiosphaeris hirsuta TaxID=260670 RepID=A0AA40A7S7_9PEZI|nr:cAMP phosphodiesterases class-II-domain-containing protein [Lasiosphaeris hirsuta]
MGGGGSMEGVDDVEGATPTPAAIVTAPATTTATKIPASPALQLIILGSGGGPIENNVTAFLVRSLAKGWGRSSIVAVDAGVHLSAILRILEETQPPGLGETEELSLPYTLTSGPFAGLEVPYATPTANATHIYHTLIDTYLITHPHLDHIAGFVINTAGLTGSRPKRIAGLPSTIAALKLHVFNNVIWPNLSDENNGVGLITYTRLLDGGSPALGEGEGRGYLEISDGLAVKTWGVSHGHCIERHSHRGSASSSVRASFDASSMGGSLPGLGVPSNTGINGGNMLSPRGSTHYAGQNPSVGSFWHHTHLQHRLQQIHQNQQQQQQSHQQHQHQQQEQRRGSLTGSSVVGGHPSGAAGGAGSMMHPSMGFNETACVYDSSAYFIRDVATGREVLIFGDVEPDSISLSPRNLTVWREAAPKIATGKLAAIVIECSYDNSQPDDRLFGHLAPRFIAEEMGILAAEVALAQDRERRTNNTSSITPGQLERRNSDYSGYTSGGEAKLKRKRDGLDDGIPGRRKNSSNSPTAQIRPTSNPMSRPPSQLLSASRTGDDSPVSPRTAKPPHRVDTGPSGLSDDGRHTVETPSLATPTAELSIHDVDLLVAANQLSIPVPQHSTDAEGEHADGEYEEERGPKGKPLNGLKIVIIHVKDKLNDGPPTGDAILRQLEEYEREAGLGIEYVISRRGQDLYF